MSNTTLMEKVSIQPKLNQLNTRGAQDRITNDTNSEYSYMESFLYEYVLSRPQFIHTDFWDIKDYSGSSGDYIQKSSSTNEWKFEVGVGPDFVTRLDLVMQVKGATSTSCANVFTKLVSGASNNSDGGKCTNALCATRTNVYTDGKAADTTDDADGVGKQLGNGGKEFSLYGYYGARDGLDYSALSDELHPTYADLQPKDDGSNSFIPGSHSFVRMAEDFGNSVWTTASLTNGAGNEYETIYSLWNHMYDTMFIPDHRRGTIMTGRTGDGAGDKTALSEIPYHNQYFITPLRFFFHDRAHFLPTISCYLQKLTIKLKIRNKQQLLFLNKDAIRSFRDLNENIAQPHIKGLRNLTNEDRAATSFGAIDKIDSHLLHHNDTTGLEAKNTGSDLAGATFVANVGPVYDAAGVHPTGTNGFMLTRDHFDPNISDILDAHSVLDIEGMPKIQCRHIILPQGTRQNWGYSQYSFLVNPMSCDMRSLDSTTVTSNQYTFDGADFHNMTSELFIVFSKKSNRDQGDYYNFEGYENANIDVDFYQRNAIENENGSINLQEYSGGPTAATSNAAHYTDVQISDTSEPSIPTATRVQMSVTPSYSEFGVNNNAGYKSLYMMIGNNNKWDSVQPAMYYTVYIPSLYYATIPNEIITCIPFYSDTNKQWNNTWFSADGPRNMTKHLPRCLNFSRQSTLKIYFNFSQAYTEGQTATVYCFYKTYNLFFITKGLLSKSWGSQAALEHSNFADATH